MRERRGSNRQAGLSPLPPSPQGCPGSNGLDGNRNVRTRLWCRMGYSYIEMFLYWDVGFAQLPWSIFTLPSKTPSDFRNCGFVKWKICETL